MNVSHHRPPPSRLGHRQSSSQLCRVETLAFHRPIRTTNDARLRVGMLARKMIHKLKSCSGCAQSPRGCTERVTRRGCSPAPQQSNVVIEAN